ncbi:MAG TPA: dTDP-4-dehydrorhamnose reductase [Rhizomicrobium sp.]|nr:dTDP-4-dehydrorhamnose reductase [Rhizomicrobium sp.]
MKCLVAGGEGQLGRALQAAAPPEAEIHAPARALCDITDAAALAAWFGKIRPAVVFNAAAYTAVDAAESDEAAAERVNAEGAGLLARMCAEHGARLVHVSTDFVFDGRAGTPYAPDDAPNPLNAYGRTKLKGEEAVASAAPGALVVRTAWVYAARGRNFVHTMLRVMRERGEVRVVADQIGTPTHARNLARALWDLSGRGASGCYHFTDSGVASWYDFAAAIAEEAAAAGLLKSRAAVVPIASRDYPAPARRPPFSVLDKSKTWAALGTTGQHWREALREMLREMDHDG